MSTHNIIMFLWRIRKNINRLMEKKAHYLELCVSGLANNDFVLVVSSFLILQTLVIHFGLININ